MIMPSDTEFPRAASTAGPRPDAGASDAAEPATPPDPLAGLTRSLAELREFAAVYVAARLDRLQVGARQALVWAALGIAGGVVGAAMLIAATVMLLEGLALGLAELLGGRVWAGNLIVATVVLAAAAATIYRVLGRFTAASRQRTIEKYERRRQSERATYGIDVAQRAHGTTGPR